MLVLIQQQGTLVQKLLGIILINNKGDYDEANLYFGTFKANKEKREYLVKQHFRSC